ncbi:MAG: VTT domain-containing protein [Candidatus Omnitrophica bacterium]|nr:VTT domain-containing protein [Candidatus Omnitrophota bacterium]
MQNFFGHCPLLYSSLLYISLYVVITFFIWFSKDIFWLAGALSFGPYLSTTLVLIAETINAFILFNISRRLGRDFVKERLSAKYRHIDEKLGNLSLSWLFLLRAVPLIPYRFFDLGAGLISISLPKFMAVIILASPIRIFWVQYILAGVGRAIFDEPYMLVDYFLRHRILFTFSLLYLILIIFVVRILKIKHDT